jgi:hypothetical protein
VLYISYTNTEKEHDDIVVQFGATSFTCDSYYFLIDEAFSDQPTTEAKVQAAIAWLVQQWINHVERGAQNQLFLPFDFSDQYTRCLECILDRNHISLRVGWSTVEGWAVLPSNIVDYVHRITDFRAETASIRVDREAFLQRLAEIRDTFQRGTP